MNTEMKTEIQQPLKPMHLLNEPRVKLPEPPVGKIWEYRGKGWTGEGDLLVCGEHNYNISRVRFANGHPSLHYWEAVDVVSTQEFTSDCFCSPDSLREALEKAAREHPSVFNVFEMSSTDEEPQYRMLEEGEIIREGDEIQVWQKLDKANACVFNVVGKCSFRRPLPQLTDSQKLTLAIEALEKARGWAVADEVLEKIL